MPKMSDTRDLVRQAWLEIYQASGSAPNDAQVKEWLIGQVGSSRNNTTVSQELQAIRRNAEKTYFESLVMPGLAADYPQELVHSTSKFFSELLVNAKSWALSAYDEQRTELQRQTQEMKEAADLEVRVAVEASGEAKAANEALMQSLGQHEATIERQQAETAALQQLVVGLEQTIAAEQVRNAQLVAMVDRVQGERDAAVVEHATALAKADDRYAGFERVMLRQVDEERQKTANFKKDWSDAKQREQALLGIRDDLARRESEASRRSIELQAMLDRLQRASASDDRQDGQSLTRKRWMRQAGGAGRKPMIKQLPAASAVKKSVGKDPEWKEQIVADWPRRAT